MSESVMGRIQELREKFRRKALAQRPEERLMRFTKTVNHCIEPKGAGGLYTSNPWITDLYKEADAVRDDGLDAWIAERVAGLFQSVASPPNWVFEPTWCFHDGVPLTFVSQMTDAEEGWELYLFAGTRDADEGETREPGSRRFYKMIVQEGYGPSDHDGSPGEIHTNGLISL